MFRSRLQQHQRLRRSSIQSTVGLARAGAPLVTSTVVASIVHPHAVIVVGHELARAGDAIIAVVNIAVARNIAVTGIAMAHDLQGERSERAAGGYPARADCELNDAEPCSLSP